MIVSPIKVMDLGSIYMTNGGGVIALGAVMWVVICPKGMELIVFYMQSLNV